MPTLYEFGPDCHLRATDIPDDPQAPLLARIAALEAQVATLRTALFTCRRSLEWIAPEYPMRIDPERGPQDPAGVNDAIRAAHDALGSAAGQALLDRLQALEEALNPLARVAALPRWEGKPDDHPLFDDLNGNRITLGDLRRAAALKGDKA